MGLSTAAYMNQRNCVHGREQDCFKLHRKNEQVCIEKNKER